MDRLPYSEWLDKAKSLTIGTKKRVDHQCGPGKTLLIESSLQGWSGYCFRCVSNGFKSAGMRTIVELEQAQKESLKYEGTSWEVRLPDDFTTDIPIDGRMWYYHAGITDAIARLYGFGWSGRQRRVIVPVYSDGRLAYVQARAIDAGSSPKYTNLRGAGRAAILFKSDARAQGYYTQGSYVPGSRVVVCEDALSAIRVGMSVQSCAILGTSLDAGGANWLKNFERVTFWLDGDKAGVKGRLSGMSTLNLMHSGTIDYINSERDPKCYNQEEIVKWLS